MYWLLLVFDANEDPGTQDSEDLETGGVLHEREGVNWKDRAEMGVDDLDISSSAGRGLLKFDMDTKVDSVG
jgi:hypothetical protein